MNDEAISRLKLLAEQAIALNEEYTEEIEANQIKKICEYLGGLYSIKTIEKILDVYKKRLSNIIRVEIPAIMNENELTRIIINGMSLTLKKGVTPKVIDEEKMIEWIEEIDQGDSIKTELKFGKGEVDGDLQLFLRENGYSFEQKNGVHYMTLKKIISDRYENGESLPPVDAVSVSPYDEVMIKRNKDNEININYF